MRKTPFLLSVLSLDKYAVQSGERVAVMGQLKHETSHREWVMHAVSGQFARRALAVFPAVLSLQFEGKV